jgi:hypothetical protein
MLLINKTEAIVFAKMLRTLGLLPRNELLDRLIALAEGSARSPVMKSLRWCGGPEESGERRYLVKA